MAYERRRRRGEEEGAYDVPIGARETPPPFEDQLTEQVMQTQPVGGGSPLQSMGVAQVGAPPSLAANAKQAAGNNFSDIEGAGGLKTGNYGVEGFGDLASTERGSNTMKKSFGKIASRYDPQQAGAASKVLQDPDFQSLWPEAEIVQHPNADLIDFDGPGPLAPVDVLRAATEGGAGEGWQWGVQDDGGGGGDVDPMGLVNQLGLGGALPGNIDQLLQGDESGIQAIIQQLMAEQQGV